MSKRLTVIIRFNGDPDDLLERFERARRLWIADQDADYERPEFFAVCRPGDGVAILSTWDAAIAHRAFGQGLHRHIEAAGLRVPAAIERLQVEKLGWD